MDVLEELKEWKANTEYGPEQKFYGRLIAEIEYLRSAIELVAMHPVGETHEWEIGAKEMLRCARSIAALWGWVDPLITLQQKNGD